jgi:DNA mismatch endonuclease (patch repair protein)
MARVRQKATGPERIVAVALRRAGLAYRLNVRSLAGSPDFANRTRRWAIFVQGCFWHHHTGCRRATTPTNNRQFWIEKFHANRRRDARAIRELRRCGYRVATIWECEARDPEKLEARISRIFEPRRVYVRKPIDH